MKKIQFDILELCVFTYPEPVFMLFVLGKKTAVNTPLSREMQDTRGRWRAKLLKAFLPKEQSFRCATKG